MEPTLMDTTDKTETSSTNTMNDADTTPSNGVSQPGRVEKGRARDAILEAAETVFGDAGIKGATTREIARVAGVNETTLFRNFASKDVLLQAVIEKNIAESRELLYAVEWTYDLKTDLTRYAELFSTHVQRHERIMRVVIGEMPRLPAEARQLFHPSNLPMKRKLLEYLDAAKERGQIRSDIPSLQLANMFLSVLIMSVLKMSVADILCEFSHEDTMTAVVEVFLHGVTHAVATSSDPSITHSTGV
jgi:AcrR family transcriptional regulator